MIRRRIGLVLALGILGFAESLRGAELTLAPSDRLLILAPHPDDETLCCGGVIQQAVQEHLPIKIVFFTYGDNNAWSFTRYRHFPVFLPKAMRAMGQVRHDEAVAAARVLGVLPDQLIFLGYPDYGTLDIWNDDWGSSPAFQSMLTRVQAVPYANAYRPGAAYKGEDILQDLQSIIKDFRPTKVFVSHPTDDRPDHRALYLFTRVALWNLAKEIAPAIYPYLTHFGDWPQPRGLNKNQALVPPSLFNDPMEWSTFVLAAAQEDKKYEALEKHRTQCVYSDPYLTSFVRSNELFFEEDRLTTIKNPDIEDWQIFIDSGDLVIAGRLPQRLKESTQVWATAYGYRGDIPFERMPKISVKFQRSHQDLYDQNRPIPNSNVRLRRDHRLFAIRIPLKTLGQPEKILISGGAERRHESPAWVFLRILDLRGSF
jgi:LmbE family N-acetylglucosaminyl deacetylase